MRLLLPFILSLLFTGCMNINIPYIMDSDAEKATDQIQENRSEAQMAQKEYLELQSQRAEQ